MSSELGFLTGESAVTYNEFAGPAPKYRAVESFTHDMGNFSILSPSLIKQQTPIGGTIDLSEPGKLSIHSTTPSRLPVSKAQIQPTSPSASIKCPEKPCFLSNTTFHCSESNYDIVKESVEKALTSLEDYDWSYFKDDCMVRHFPPFPYSYSQFLFSSVVEMQILTRIIVTRVTCSLLLGFQC